MRIQICRIRRFLGLLDPDPDPLVRGTDPDTDPDPDPDPLLAKIVRKNLDSYCFGYSIGYEFFLANLLTHFYCVSS
jgi:hypothetical protein